MPASIVYTITSSWRNRTPHDHPTLQRTNTSRQPLPLSQARQTLGINTPTTTAKTQLTNRRSHSQRRSTPRFLLTAEIWKNQDPRPGEDPQQGPTDGARLQLPHRLSQHHNPSHPSMAALPSTIQPETPDGDPMKPLRLSPAHHLHLCSHPPIRRLEGVGAPDRPEN